MERFVWSVPGETNTFANKLDFQKSKMCKNFVRIQETNAEMGIEEKSDRNKDNNVDKKGK